MLPFPILIMLWSRNIDVWHVAVVGRMKNKVSHRLKRAAWACSKFRGQRTFSLVWKGTCHCRWQGGLMAWSLYSLRSTSRPARATCYKQPRPVLCQMLYPAAVSLRRSKIIEEAYKGAGVKMQGRDVFEEAIWILATQSMEGKRHLANPSHWAAEFGR